MIFVTVGGQGPFDRMIHTVDRWAAALGRADVFAQIGDSQQPPRHIAWCRYLAPDAFRERMGAAEVIVSHAGMGTILSAAAAGVPILVMPRRARYGEQRNDHQVDTARRLQELAGLPVADNEGELIGWLDRLGELEKLVLAGNSRGDLLRAIRSFVAEG